RVFDPDDVARLETAMWRSYYDRRRMPLFGQLVALLPGQFHLQPLRAVALAGLAARAAAVFQVGESHDDYRRALPYLERYYHGIRAVSEVPFDPRRAAWLELEWWIVHREGDDHPPRDLEAALAARAAGGAPWPAGGPSPPRPRPSACGPTPAGGPRPWPSVTTPPAARSGCWRTTGTGSRPSSGSPGRPWPTRPAW